jgi:pterin-4a-carbinolamine dehydratase
VSRLLENIINKSMSIDFDMSKSYSENINNKNISKLTSSFNDVPIDPIESTWQEVKYDNKLYFEKIYTFNDTKHIKYFLSEYFDVYKKLGYEPELFIKGRKVKVYLGNPDFGDVSELDIQFSKFLDEVYEDIFYVRD